MSTDKDLVIDTNGQTGRTNEHVQVEGVTPIVVDLGSRSKKAIRRLKEGRGKLMAQVSDTVEQVRSSLGEEDKEIVPVVIVYRKKASKRGGRLSATRFVPPPFNLFG